MPADEPYPSGPGARARRGRLLRSLAVLLALALLGSLPLLMPSDGHAAAPLLGDADVHVDAGELEINLSLSQTQNTCGATALNGQLCLRYSVEENETPVASGYGLIAASDVTMSGAGVTLTTNTTSYPGFHLVEGAGGALTISWTTRRAPPARANGWISTLAPATVEGSVLGRKLAGAIVQADVLTYQ